MRIACIASAGASAFFAAADACPHVEFACITDRTCGADNEARRRGIAHERIDERSSEAFSLRAARALRRLGWCDAVIVMFGRLLAPPLVGVYPLLNIHPSLLPAFPGLGAVRAAAAAGVERFGATMHGMTMNVDGGPIVAQVSTPLDPGASAAWLLKQSFIHKLYLVLLAVDLLERDAMRFENGLPVLSTASPSLQNERYAAHVAALAQREGVHNP